MRPAGTRWLVIFLGLSLGILAGAALGAGAAFAESNQGRGVELLSRAAKAYQAGAYNERTPLMREIRLESVDL